MSENDEPAPAPPSRRILESYYLKVFDESSESILYCEEVAERLDAPREDVAGDLSTLEALGYLGTIDLGDEVAYWPVYAPRLSDETARRLYQGRLEVQRGDTVSLEGVTL